MKYPLALILGIGSVAQAQAAGDIALEPHRAVYDLKLSNRGSEIQGAEGRIAMELAMPACGEVSLDYRFVAQFVQAQEIVLTRQLTRTQEDLAQETFAFRTETSVDGMGGEVVSGSARNEGGRTIVMLDEPDKGAIEIPLSEFPAAHTLSLIESALAGERVVQSRLFDGDDEAEKLLTSTAIIGEMREAERGQGEGDPLSGLKSWPVVESYYNSDSDPDGLPIFSTSYRLYENGVSDDLVLDYGDYALKGGLSELELLEDPDCG